MAKRKTKPNKQTMINLEIFFIGLATGILFINNNILALDNQKPRQTAGLKW
jgi:hypothetical protein